MKNQVNKYQLYNLLYSGVITMKEYIRALSEIRESGK
jgi:hypothetical protein